MPHVALGGYATGSGNRMTNVQSGNKKLKARAARILRSETGLDETSAAETLDAAAGDLRVALVMSATQSDALTARKALNAARGVVRNAIAELQKAT